MSVVAQPAPSRPAEAHAVVLAPPLAEPAVPAVADVAPVVSSPEAANSGFGGVFSALSRHAAVGITAARRFLAECLEADPDGDFTRIMAQAHDPTPLVGQAEIREAWQQLPGHIRAGGRLLIAGAAGAYSSIRSGGRNVAPRASTLPERQYTVFEWQLRALFSLCNRVDLAQQTQPDIAPDAAAAHASTEVIGSMRHHFNNDETRVRLVVRALEARRTTIAHGFTYDGTLDDRRPWHAAVGDDEHEQRLRQHAEAVCEVLYAQAADTSAPSPYRLPDGRPDTQAIQQAAQQAALARLRTVVPSERAAHIARNIA